MCAGAIFDVSFADVGVHVTIGVAIRVAVGVSAAFAVGATVSFHVTVCVPNTTGSANVRDGASVVVSVNIGVVAVVVFRCTADAVTKATRSDNRSFFLQSCCVDGHDVCCVIVASFLIDRFLSSVLLFPFFLRFPSSLLLLCATPARVGVRKMRRLQEVRFPTISICWMHVQHGFFDSLANKCCMSSVKSFRDGRIHTVIVVTSHRRVACSSSLCMLLVCFVYSSEVTVLCPLLVLQSLQS